MEAITLTTLQKRTLSHVVNQGGKADITSLDARSANALERRGLVKVSETRKGIFVTVTAKGKKLN